MLYFIGIALFAGVAIYIVYQTYGPSGALKDAGAVCGPIDSYFQQITKLQAEGLESFFVTAVASDDTHFIQVSVDKDATGRWVYQFDMPITNWSKDYSATIENEARARGLTPVLVDGTGNMRFLDIDFADRAAHDTFVIWVVEDVFNLPRHETFDVMWG